MLTIAIIGRPNTGKSTLFNRLSKSRKALVADIAGLTRDRQYAKVDFNGTIVNLIDTGGLTGNKNMIDDKIKDQVLLAINESDVVYFIVSSKDGLVAMDSEIANIVRPFIKKVILIANKSENNKSLSFEFFELGLGSPFLISAEHGIGITELIEKTSKDFITTIDKEKNTETNLEENIILTVLGRPNVGKSTLINRMLGKERVLVVDMPGTTRDSIEVPFKKDGIKYTLIDTAGIRRKRNVHNKIEIFSILKAREAIVQSNVIMLILDANEGVTEQDASLLGMIHDNHKSLLIIVNKWDGLNKSQKDDVNRKLDLKLSFITYASIHYISALHGSGVGKLFKHINIAYKNANAKFNTAKLNKILELANASHNPPSVAGRRAKLKYVYQSNILPPTFTFYGNHTLQIPASYQRFLKNIFIKELKLQNTPIKLIFKQSDNPFKDKKNILNARQIKKKRRMMKFIKNKK